MDRFVCIKNSNYLHQNFDDGRSFDLICGRFENEGMCKK